MLTLNRIKQVVTEVGRRYGIKNAYLFGSYAKHSANEKSDVDLIIDKGDIHSFKEFYHLHEDLEKELGVKVDLLTDRGITSRFFDRIKNDRILLYGV